MKSLSYGKRFSTKLRQTTRTSTRLANITSLEALDI